MNKNYENLQNISNQCDLIQFLFGFFLLGQSELYESTFDVFTTGSTNGWTQSTFQVVVTSLFPFHRFA